MGANNLFSQEFGCSGTHANETTVINGPHSYLFKEKHDHHEDLGEGKTFKLPLPMDQIQSQTLKVTLKNDALAFQSSFEGKYTKSDTLVNGKPNWVSNDYAIWYQDEDVTWNIGNKTTIGKKVGFICGNNVTHGPDDDNISWRYWNPIKKWINDLENDVSVQSIFDKGNLNLLKIWVEK